MELKPHSIAAVALSLNAMAKRMQDEGMMPHAEKTFSKLYSKRQAADICGVSRPKLDAFLKENPEYVEAAKTTGGRLSLDDVTKIREILNPMPKGPAVVVSFQNSKGGVAKTTGAVFLAQHAAQKGYRVLLIDGDPQGSATSMFGVIPDVVVSEDQTILPFVTGRQPDLDYCIRKSYHPNIDLIQGCLTNTVSEQVLVQGMLGQKSDEFYKMVHRGLHPIKRYYDLIIFDTPPSHSMLASNYIFAADLLVVPTPPSSFDITATAQFCTMVGTLCQNTGREDPAIRFLKTKYEANKGNAKRIAAMLHEHVPNQVYEHPFPQMALVQSALEKYCTPFEMTPEFKSEHNVRVPKQAMDVLTNCFDQILADVMILKQKLSETVGA